MTAPKNSNNDKGGLVLLGLAVLLFFATAGTITHLYNTNAAPTANVESSGEAGSATILPDIAVKKLTQVDAGSKDLIGSFTFKADTTNASSALPTKTIKKLNLSNSRVLRLYEQVGMNALYLADQINEMNLVSKAPIYLLINSPGGSVLAGAILISAMQASAAPVVTICEVLCASMAAMIHQYGTSRYQTDRSIIMFHPASGSAQGEVDKMTSFLGTLKRYTNKMEADVAARVGISFETYKSKAAVELWVDAEDARASNFNDAIVSVTRPTYGLGAGPEEDNKIKKYKQAYSVLVSGGRDLIWIMPGKEQ